MTYDRALHFLLGLLMGSTLVLILYLATADIDRPQFTDQPLGEVCQHVGKSVSPSPSSSRSGTASRATASRP